MANEISLKSLHINVRVRGAMTPDQILSLRDNLQQQVDKYLISLPVLTPSLPRESYELVEVGL